MKTSHLVIALIFWWNLGLSFPLSRATGTVPEDRGAPLAAVTQQVDAVVEQLAQQGPEGRALVAAPDGQLAGRWEKRSSFLRGRIYHTAVSSYEGMIVWGGGSEHQFYDDGGIYDVAEDRWQPISKEKGPSGRWGHAAVWTGREMIVWGGRSSFAPSEHKDDGALYDPQTDSWRPMSRQNAPEPRSQMAAVWTGEEMLVWGGWTDGGACPGTGGSYNPRTDSWTPLPVEGAPVGRMDPAFVWTGRELIVWGGFMTDGERSCGSGGRYDPEKRKWRPLSADGAPLSVRGASAVWTGKEMLVWGGAHLDGSTPVNVGLRSGSRYNPDSDSWRPMSLEGAPEGRLDCGATWTGTELIVWSGGDQVKGYVVSGGRYDPATDHWVATANLGVPAGRSLMSSVWSGEGVLFFGGSTGGVGAFNENLYYLPDRTAAPPP